MCYNCGCGLPDDDMGVGHALAEPNGKSLTDKSFKILSEKWNVSENEAKKITLELLTGEKNDIDLKSELNSLMDEAAKSQGMTIEESQDETIKLLKQVLH